MGTWWGSLGRWRLVIISGAVLAVAASVAIDASRESRWNTYEITNSCGSVVYVSLGKPNGGHSGGYEAAPGASTSIKLERSVDPIQAIAAEEVGGYEPELRWAELPLADLPQDEDGNYLISIGPGCVPVPAEVPGA